MEIQDFKPTHDSVDVFASGAIGGVLSWMLGEKKARHEVARQVWRGVARLGLARHGRAGTVR